MRRRLPWLIATVLVSPLLVAAPRPAAAQAADGAGTVAYEVTLSGVDGDLREDLIAASRLYDLRDQPPASVLGLRRRAEQDAGRLRKVLESQGHYAATIRHTVDTGQAPAQVTLAVEAGPVYRLRAFDIAYQDAARADRLDLPRTLDDLAPKTPGAERVAEYGDPATADRILDAIDRTRRLLRERGFPDAEIGGHKATVNHQDQSMAVTVTADAGRRAVFGDVSLSGQETVEASYILRHRPWAPGDLYDVEEVETFRRRLLASGLFDTVTVEPSGPVGEDGVLPMAVTVEEAEQRSIGVGARYSTSLGPTVSAFWEHRNLLGADEDFRVEAEASPKAQILGADLEKPHFLRWDQTLGLSASLNREQFEAYHRSAIEGAASIDRRLSDHLTVGAGVTADYARLTGDRDRRSTIVGLPLTLALDTSDDLLDPTEGARLSLDLIPYTGTYDGPVTFGKVRGELAAYTDLSGDGDTVLGSRIGVGAMIGAGRSGIPPDKRFYAGGGGSVRGFGYQMAGALDSENDPIGGNALFEASLELRQKVTESIGIVPFVDVGRAYTDSLPSLEEDLFLAFGLGGRYYSPIGPVRLDVALPVRPRRNIDDRYQFYVSLGQAF